MSVPKERPLAIIDAAMVLPVKLRLRFNAPVPQGAPWRWHGSSNLYDPITGWAPNHASGACADWPGVYVPPIPPNILSAVATGYGATLEFDRPVVLSSTTPDSSIPFNGSAPITAQSINPTVLHFETPIELFTVSPWQIDAQPAYIMTPLSWPASGALA